MEIKLKEICAGARNKNEVIHETLEQYREVFVRTSQQIEVLKAVRSVLCILPHDGGRVADC